MTTKLHCSSEPVRPFPHFTPLAFLAILALSTINSQLSTLYAQGTAFTYNGRLTDGGSPANGSYELRLILYTADLGGIQLGPILTKSPTPVTNGLFTATLDFGPDVFTGEDRFLEVAARTNGTGAFTTLSPRQKITATPYAITASNLTGPLSAGQLSGTLPSAQLSGPYSSAVTFNNVGNSFSGNGALLTALNASQLTSGTVPGARLSGAYSSALTLNNAGNSFSGTFAGNGGALTNLNLSLSLTGAVSFTTNASGSFGFAIASAPTVGAGPIAVSVADVNGDGSVDLISANQNDATISVLTNNGSGVFFHFATFAVGNGIVAIVAADVNGDGKVDLIGVNDGANTLAVLTNNGLGGFLLRSTLTVGASPSAVTAADVNGDGKVDLICANSGANTLTVLTNNGSGGFVLRATPSVGTVPESVVAADVNGDGRVDLISANSGDNTLSVLLQNPSGGFSLASSPVVGGGPRCVVAANVNADGTVDLICANSTSGTLTVLTNNGGGVFGSDATLTPGAARSVTAADVNGDGKVDLIATRGGNNSLTVYTNNGSGGFAFAFNLSVGSGTDPESLVATDANADGTMDLITANHGNGTLTVLTNTLTGTSITSQFTGGRVLVDPGSASLPGYGFVGDENTGIFEPSVNANIVAIATGGGERMRVTSSGVGIGTTTPSASKALTLRGVGASSGLLQFRDSTGSDRWHLTFENGGLNFVESGVTANRLLLADGGQVGIGRVPTANLLEVEGNVSKTAAGSWLANSDARIKTAVHTVTHALEKLAQVRPVEFRYTEDYRAQHPSIEDRPYLNVIAQEFQKVFPEAVKSSGDKLPNGEPILQVDSYPLTIYSAAAIQELNRKVEDQRAENAHLKQRLEKLERLLSHEQRGAK